MARDKDLLRASSIGCYMLEHPCDGFGGIVEQQVNGHFWQQTIVNTNNHHTFLLKITRHFLLTSFESAAMKPYDNGHIGLSLRIIDIKQQSFLRIAVGFYRIADVTFPFVVIGTEHRLWKKGKKVKR